MILSLDLPLFLLAAVYEKPGCWPVLRPKRPFKLGPVLCFPPLKTKSGSCETNTYYIRKNVVLYEQYYKDCLITCFSSTNFAILMWMGGHFTKAFKTCKIRVK